MELTGYILTALVALLIGALTLNHERGVLRSKVAERIAELYDQVVRYKIEYPFVFRISREWNNGYQPRIYAQESDEDKKIAVYYSFAELCLGYCNEVLKARQRHLLPETNYDNHYKPLIKLLLTENYPFFHDCLREGDYISSYLKKFHQTMTSEGWDWYKQHQVLTQGTD